MAKYECNNGLCRPCQHIESKVTCPGCGLRLIIAPHHKWIYCRNFYDCEFEMTPEKFEAKYQRIPELKRDIDV